MPFVRIHLRQGQTRAFREAIADNVYEALRETFNVPEEDKFIVIDEIDPDNFIFSKSYMDIARSDDFVLLQLTVSNTRTVSQKKALFERIVQRLGNNPKLRAEDIFINLVEVQKENWSFGLGLAQYAL